MRHVLAIVGLAFALPMGSTRAQQPGSLFRYIHLSPKDTIALGQPFVTSGVADEVANHIYQLRPGTFGGAERIRILTDSAGRVTTMEFEYADGSDFPSMFKEYVHWLGTPTAIDSTARRRVVAWQDSLTRFELSVVTVGARQILSTRMIDVTHKH